MEESDIVPNYLPMQRYEMTDEKLDQPRNITLRSDRMQSETILKQETQSHIQAYGKLLVERAEQSETPEEFEKWIKLRQEVYKLDRNHRQLDYAQQSAEFQFEKDIFQRRQQVIASVISVGIGICFIQTFPLAGLLIVILGLAKPLGYSLGEIGELLDDLTGFSKNSNKLQSNSNDQDIQSEEPKNAR